MSKSLNDRNETLPLEFGLLREHADELADPWSSFCHGCGACVDHCLAAKHGVDFDPREIMLKARYGLADKLLIQHSVLWQCFGCNACYEPCPQPVKPVEIITWLREMLPSLVSHEHRGGS